jgi:putative DNA methylase
MNSTCPRLIEVALPIREISAESVRDKNIHHAHISHLHIWWARRPLATSRAVVFASLVPDPDHPDCPSEFRSAVIDLLKEKINPILKGYRRGKIFKNDPDPYRPYPDLDDTPRNRLLTFIAKWSPEWRDFEKGFCQKQPATFEVLDDRCLVKWETSDPENEQGNEILRIARKLVAIANGQNVPLVLDPFSGGGAIPLEASRLGCKAIANDYNPVAYLILRATCEFPQLYGKPGKRIISQYEYGQIKKGEVEVDNVLVHDFEHWANWILERTKQQIGHLYQSGYDGRQILDYLWARTVPCSNPSCGMCQWFETT